MKANGKTNSWLWPAFCLLAATALQAQSAYPGAGFRLPAAPATTPLVFKPVSSWPAGLPPLPTAPRRSVLLPLWSAEELPVFCKIEHQWAKKLPMPVKFRLGSVEYVDWLEGKVINY